MAEVGQPVEQAPAKKGKTIAAIASFVVGLGSIVGIIYSNPRGLGQVGIWFFIAAFGVWAGSWARRGPENQRNKLAKAGLILSGIAFALCAFYLILLPILMFLARRN